MIDLASHEMTMLRQTVRGFVRDRLEPLEQQIETDDDVSPDLLAKLRSEAAELGIYGFNLPPELGGYGLPVAAQVGILEEVTHTSVPLSEVVGFLPLSLIHLNEEQRARILPDLASGRVTMTYALTEPDAGSDLSSIRTRAVKVDGGWRLEGAKQFISNVETCDYVIVLAVSDHTASLKGRLTTFIVKRSNPGLVGMTRYKKMGWHGYHLNGFSLEDCFVPDADVLGRPGDGFMVMMASINHDRILSACRSLGLAQRAHDMSIAYAKERRAFGSQLASHQAIQFMIADNDVEIEATRALIYRAAALCDQEDSSSRIAVSRAKLYASEMGCRVVDRCLQIFGGMGYMCELPIERFYRDARAFRLGEGTSEMQRIQIARQALSN
ncbi:acyl-CoA dehydrogenase family protein [Bradyrhizobium sp. RD5-C2]|uniref:acyl-CoA dehydrogenase family protein n=1 Tax=Bradyrhizobium sp. RD5-C2 TaxID=244562 RepID=UPI001CC6E9A7|nr:acyl-CoA dehydrogenase family protein [Bradyrhizobium sp. RD5-C2]GIQ76874.1 acyl-CoA dehydrogenase [Bradyrhizobium sp. RD5-C2]